MRYILNIAGANVLLTDAQLTALDEAIAGALVDTQKWVGTGNGDEGTSTVRVVEPIDFTTVCVLKAMRDDLCDALVLRGKLLKEETK
jgi:hypothetical protein